MHHSKVLVVQLQEDLNLLDALSLVSATTKALQGIRNEADLDNQVKAAVAMARQPRRRIQATSQVWPPLRFDDRRANEADVGFASFYPKEMFSVLDQLITDCRENWNRVFATIEPFLVLLPPWKEINEESMERLCMLLGGSIHSGSLIGELSILREMTKDGIPLQNQSVKEVAGFVSAGFVKRSIWLATVCS